MLAANVGAFWRTTEPVPVAVVDAVPPFAMGRAPDPSVMAMVPDEVMGDPETARMEGTVTATEVTVPDVVGAAQDKIPAAPEVVRT